jgi:hypothetical protein
LKKKNSNFYFTQHFAFKIKKKAPIFASGKKKTKKDKKKKNLFSRISNADSNHRKKTYRPVASGHVKKIWCTYKEKKNTIAALLSHIHSNFKAASLNGCIMFVPYVKKTYLATLTELMLCWKRKKMKPIPFPYVKSIALTSSTQSVYGNGPYLNPTEKFSALFAGILLSDASTWTQIRQYPLF